MRFFSSNKEFGVDMGQTAFFPAKITTWPPKTQKTGSKNITSLIVTVCYLMLNSHIKIMFFQYKARS